MTREVLALLLICCSVAFAFDFREGILSDGFHDLLGLTPYWMLEREHDDLRRTIGTKRDSLPSNWANLISNTSGTATYVIAGSCNINAMFTSANITMETSKAGGCTKPSLAVVMRKLFPTISIDSTTDSFILPDNFVFEGLEIVRDNKEVTIKAMSKESWGMSERRILLENAKLTLGFTANQTITNIKNWHIKVKGTFNHPPLVIQMSLDKPKGESGMSFTWNLDSTSIEDFMGIFGNSLVDLNVQSVAFEASKLVGIQFTNPEITGQIQTDGTFQIVSKANVGFSSTLKDEDVYVILTRVKGGIVSPAVVLAVTKIVNIKQLFEFILNGYDFAGNYGMIEKIQDDSMIMISREDVVMVKNEALEKVISAFITEYDTKSIPKGLHIRVKVPLKANMLKNCDPNVKFNDDVPDIFPMTIAIGSTGLEMRYPDKFKADLPSMLKCIDPKYAASLPSDLFPDPNGILDIKEMHVAANRYVKIVVAIQGPFEFFGGKISLPDLQITVEWTNGDGLKFTGAATITVGKLVVAISLEKEGKSYTLTAVVDSFRLDQLEEMIGPNTLSNYLSFLGPMKDFGIKNFRLVKAFGEDSDHSLRVSGVPVLWGWDKLSLQGLIWTPTKPDQPDKAIAIGMVFENVRLDHLMEKIFGEKLFSTAWFSDMTAIVILSNADGTVSEEDEEEEDTDSTDKEKTNDDNGNNGNSDSNTDSGPDSRAAMGKHQQKRVKDESYHIHIDQARREEQRTKHKRRMRRIRRKRKQKKKEEGVRFYAHNPAVMARKKKATKPSNARRFGQMAAFRPMNRTRNSQKGMQPRQPERLSTATAYRKDDETEGEDEEEEDEEEPITFDIPYLSDQDILPGLTLIGIFRIPQDNGCKGDSLCLWLSEKVGAGATIEISGRIGKGEFAIGAKLSANIVLVKDKLNLQEIALNVEVNGKESKVSLSCTLFWHDKEILGNSTLLFIGAIEVSLTGELSLEFTMKGIWRRPFGFEYLAFGNLHLAIGYSVGAPLPSFEFGAEVWVGKIKETGPNDHAIKVKGYFGIDPGRPSDNYIYASISSFTLKSIYTAFELGEPSVPDFVANSGFPEGITVAYSLEGKEIEALGIVIDAGLYLKGTIDFLGFRVSAEIVVNPPEKLLVDVQLSPIDWAGGLIQLRKNATDVKNGPSAYILILEDSVTVKIHGYISLLGFSREIQIEVTDQSFKFRIEEKLWTILSCSLEVEASYGSLASLSFSFVARLKIDLHLKDFADSVNAYLDKAATAAKEKLKEAQDKLAEAQQALRNAEAKMEGWENDISAYQDRLRRRAAEIEEAKKAFEASCDRECGRICIPFFGWNPRCFKLWWWWIGCPTWDNCKWRVKNVICIAACEIRKLAKKFVAWAEQIGIKILLGLTEIGKGLIKVGKGFVKLADGLLEFGKDVLKFAEDIVDVGLKIAKDIVTAAGKIFQLNLLELRGKLDPDFNACVGITLDCVIVGIDIYYTGDVCVNLNFWGSVAADSSEKKYRGTKEMNNKLPEVNSKVEEFNKDKKNLDEEEKKVEKEVHDEVNDRRKRKRDHVPTAHELYYSKLAEERLPHINIRGPATVNAFKNDAPWVLIKDFDARNFDHMPIMDENVPAEKRTLDEDWEKHAHTPCVQIHKVIDKYSMIAEGLSSLSSSMRNARENYQTQKRSMQLGVDSLRDQVKDTEMKHNMTNEEREDLYHWYKEANEGLSRYKQKAEAVMDDQHKLSLPRFRSQINHILMTEKKTDFVGYMNELHKVGEAAYKRSSIPNENMIEAAQELKRIKKDLIDLVHSELQHPLKFMYKVRSIQSNIQGLRRSMERCK